MALVAKYLFSNSPYRAGNVMLCAYIIGLRRALWKQKWAANSEGFGCPFWLQFFDVKLPRFCVPHAFCRTLCSQCKFFGSYVRPEYWKCAFSLPKRDQFGWAFFDQETARWPYVYRLTINYHVSRCDEVDPYHSVGLKMLFLSTLELKSTKPMFTSW